MSSPDAVPPVHSNGTDRGFSNIRALSGTIGTEPTIPVERFVAEARLTSQLEHPNIVPVHDFGIDEYNRAWYAMKKVEGVSLDAILRDLRREDPTVVERWTLPRLLRAFVQMCKGLGYAHERGVIHRDLKPENIMVGPPRGAHPARGASHGSVSAAVRSGSPRDRSGLPRWG
jgi:serine/threonine protein kinase